MDSEVIFVSTSTYQVDRSGARARAPRMPTSRVASLGQEKTWPKVKKERHVDIPRARVKYTVYVGTLQSLPRNKLARKGKER